MREYGQSPTAVIFDNFVRVFFSCRPERKDNLPVSYLTFIDLDRNDLFKVIRTAREPLLPLGDLGSFDEFGTNPASAIRFGTELRLYYCGWSRCESVPFNCSIGLAVSKDDGASFVKLGQGPVLSFSPDEPFLVGSPRIKRISDRWYLWYAVGRRWLPNDGQPEPVYKIRVAQSDDGVNWVKSGSDLVPDVIDPNECQASPEVFFYNGRFHMLFSYRHGIGYRSGEKGYRIGYAESSDLLTWKRQDEKAGITVSESGWDSEMISYPHVFELDGSLYMFYQGNGFGKTGFGLAKLKSTKQAS